MSHRIQKVFQTVEINDQQSITLKKLKNTQRKEFFTDLQPYFDKVSALSGSVEGEEVSFDLTDELPQLIKWVALLLQSCEGFEIEQLVDLEQKSAFVDGLDLDVIIYLISQVIQQFVGNE
jgi:hypothetical protein